MVPPLREPSPQPRDLESRIRELSDTVGRLEARVTQLEAQARQEPLEPEADGIPPAPAPEPEAAPALGLVPLLALIGQVFLILGGAFFFRSLTDAGTLPRLWGAALGLAYALGWLPVAWRARSPVSATVYALASVLITYPLVWESTTTFAIFRAPQAVLVLLLASILQLGVAWLRLLKAAAWINLLAALATAFGLMAVTQALPWFTLLFLGWGAGSLWLTYGRRWHALRWPTALAADLAVLILTVLTAWPGGPPEGYRTLTPRLGMGAGLALVLIYLGSFAVRMLQRRRTLNPFEVIQTALVLLIGFGGSLRVALVSGSGAGLLGGGVLAAGLGSYGAAFPFAADREDLRANFSFFTTLAVTFLLLGGAIVLPALPFVLAAGALGLASLLLGLRLRRTILLLQAAGILVAMAAASGLFAWILKAYLAQTLQLPTPADRIWVTVALLATAHGLLVVRRPGEPMGWRFRLPSCLLGTLAMLGLGAGLIWIVLRALGPAPVTAGHLAAIRTVVLS
ncbi:MAG TPA: hypothetical protein VF768_00060, partial [Holophagaceae bacterium]